LDKGLRSGSIKNAAVVACSDIGASIPFISSTSKIFLFQNFGHSFETGGMVESIAQSEIENVVVYGHSDCGYRKFLVKSEEGCRSQDGAPPGLYEAAIESENEDDWKVVGQYHVLNEIKKMHTNPVLALLLANKRLQIHGWFYNSESKQLEVFDPNQNAFIEAGCDV
jgi:carbonic anhydrase